MFNEENQRPVVAAMLVSAFHGKGCMMIIGRVAYGFDVDLGNASRRFVPSFTNAVWTT
jgi:hypothetical protein